MKKIVSVFLAILLLLMTMPAYAAGTDTTAPTVSNLSWTNNTTDAPGSLELNFDLVEDGVGVKEISFFYSTPQGEGMEKYLFPFVSENERLFTGHHKLTVEIPDNFAKGYYKLTDIMVRDANNNDFLVCDRDIGWDSLIGSTLDFTVVNSNADATPPVISNLSWTNDKTNAPGSLELNFDLIEDESGLDFMVLMFESPTGQNKNIWPFYNSGSEPLLTGRHKMNIPIDSSFPSGSYRLKAIDIIDKSGNRTMVNEWSGGAEWEAVCDSLSFTVENSSADVTPPVINRLSLKNSSIQTPDLWTVTMDLVEDGVGMSSMQFIYRAPNGGFRYLDWSYFDDTEVLKTGIHQIKIPITPFWGGDGRYELLYVSLIDKNGNETFYEREGAWGDAVGDSLDFTLASVFDVAYYGSLSNSMGTLVGKIKAMNDGETAVLDARNSTKAPKELFLAIAGTDKTLVFENDDIQWVFSGRDIKTENCKDIDVAVSVSTAPGEELDFPDEGSVVKLDFADNGILPGEADIRINNDYLVYKYSQQAGNLLLSYVKDEETPPVVEDNDVELEEDNFAVAEITHNSTFVLSKNKASAAVPRKVTARSAGASSVQLSWRTVNADKYYIYRAIKKNGAYKRVATLKGSKTSYTDQKLTTGRTYYYKIRAVKGSLKSKYSAVVSAKACLRTPAVKVARDKSLTAARVSWGKVTGASKYEVYRAASRNGKYRRIATVSGSKRSLINKNLKAGKAYYYKVRAVYRTKKGNSALSSAKAVMLKPSVPGGVKLTKALERAVLKWNRVAEASGYQVFCSTKKNEGYRLAKRLTKRSSVSYKSGKLKPGTTYYYKVRSYKTVRGKRIYGDFSAVKSVRF